MVMRECGRSNRPEPSPGPPSARARNVIVALLRAGAAGATGRSNLDPFAPALGRWCRRRGIVLHPRDFRDEPAALAILAAAVNATSAWKDFGDVFERTVWAAGTRTATPVEPAQRGSVSHLTTTATSRKYSGDASSRTYVRRARPREEPRG